MIVRSRAPLRLGLAGGGTDVSPYSDRFGGLVLNVTIDKYAYATIATRDDGDVRLVAADNCVEWQGPAAAVLEPVAGLGLHVGVYNRIVRDYNGGEPLAVTITTHSEAPPGSGLGSSSTMVVALVHAFCEYLQIPLGEYDVAHLAYEIERGDLRLAGGKQDQYAAAFGGLNFMEFYGGDRVIVNPLRIKQSVKAELESSLVLFYTGVSRESAKIIEQQTASVTDKDTTSLEALHRVREEATKMKEAILKGDFERFAQSMRLSWESKKKTAKSISNSSIDQVYDAALAAGALAGKVSGAGGGGFMMFIVEPTSRPAVMRKLSEFSGQVFTCNFTEHGAYSWRN
ncbi:dehydrogenase [Burkholderia stagnalis]|uniref:Dehydrogenase n=1 Tax=Burkholderia stagnalis TaxID=1503054 RepID=A0A6L3MZ96_9BURK|nr:dehydrogenase [Burkholderia stagnalis]KAB0638880.1 dehydrogenase [Burkholderia stagnalis]KVN31132.1 dehydrogenase [Burkholderia stagnalis]KVN61658.1 dehydrogenase [Burkholderia stagnalis]KVO38227.1 dehydrogenase [Burkholderia stagnalis]KVO73097.1 dehydrogenase [Burkholderia stagnalis]